MANKISQLIVLGEDCFIHLLLYLSSWDSLQLSQTCKLIHECCLEERVWQLQCWLKEPFQSMLRYEFESIAQIKDFFGVETYLKLYQCFYRLSCPFFGLFHRVPNYPQTYRGGLYCVYPDKVAKVIYCEYFPYGTDDNADEAHELFPIKYNKATNTFTWQSPDVPPDAEFQETITFRSNELLCDRITQLMDDMKEVEDIYRFRAVMRDDVSTPKRLQHILPHCRGFMTSPYGPHGLELLQIRLQTEAGEDIPYPAPTPDTPPVPPVFSSLLFPPTTTTTPSPPPTATATEIVHLQGLKLSGDPNVAACQLSFSFQIPLKILSFSANSQSTGEDLLTPVSVDFLSWFHSDRRPVVQFPPGVHVDLVARYEAGHIQGCFPGMGQINRMPGTWFPEWVPCQLIVYQAATRPSWHLSYPPSIASPGMLPLRRGGRHHPTTTIHNHTHIHPSSAAVEAVEGGEGVSFTIVWKDEHSFFRHAMDFVQFPPNSLLSPPPISTTTSNSSSSSSSSSSTAGEEEEEEGIPFLSYFHRYANHT